MTGLFQGFEEDSVRQHKGEWRAWDLKGARRTPIKMGERPQRGREGEALGGLAAYLWDLDIYRKSKAILYCL